MLRLKELTEKWFVENVYNAPPLSNDDLSSFYKNNNVVLPSDLIEYFTVLNGTGGECTDELYEFYSINKLIK